MSDGVPAPSHELGTLAIMGLDGTGKTTLAELLETTGSERSRRPVRLHHASTKVPGLRQLKARYHSVILRNLRPSGSRPCLQRREWHQGKDPLLTIRRAVAWALSLYLLLGSFIKSFWYRLRYRRKVLILDRCFLDDVIKVRWRFGTQTKLSSLLMRAVPAPSVIVVLEGDPEVTFGRKKARNCTFPEYLEKRRILELILREAVKLGWRVEPVKIDGRSPAEVYHQVCRILQSHGIPLGIHERKTSKPGDGG